jgi:hypothetical protein
MYPKKSTLYIGILFLLLIIAFDLYMQSFIEAKNNFSNPNPGMGNFIPAETDSLKPLDFLRWVKNPAHGLKIKQTSHHMIYEAFYKPKEYIIISEERSLRISDTLLRRKLNDYAGIEFWDLKISNPENEDQVAKSGLNGNEMTDKIRGYLESEFQKDIRLVFNGDTIPCYMFHYEKSNGIIPQSKFLLGFSVNITHINTSAELIITNPFFQTEDLHFPFDKNALGRIPKMLTTNKYNATFLK